MAESDPRAAVLTRRQALIAAGTGVAAVAGGLGWWRPWENAGGRRRVAVIGAGLAGLTAAYELDRAGLEVFVLESRDRVGGRVRTLREPFREGQHAELGGEFIDRVHRAIRLYARRFGLPLEDATAGFGDLAGGIYLRSQGRVRVASSLYGPADRRQLGRFWRAVRELGRAVRIRDPVGGAAGLDRRSVGELLDELGTDGLARVRLGAYVRDEYGVEPAELSLLGFVRLERIYASVPEADIEAYRIEGGNDRLPEAFAERLGESVLLRRAVTAVADEGNRVRVRAGGEEWTAERAVLAAPLPALREIEFVPPLPPPLAGAVAELQYGRVTKVALQFPDRFWRERGFSGDVISDVPELRTWEASDQQPGGEGILIDNLAARGNDAVAPLEPAERGRLAAGAVGAAFPGSPEPIAAASAAWQRERYSGGCWASPAPGQVTRFWDALRGSRGRLHLAGEHTDPVFGSYMEGAVRSGRRAAAEIIERG